MKTKAVKRRKIKRIYTAPKRVYIDSTDDMSEEYLSAGTKRGSDTDMEFVLAGIEREETLKELLSYARNGKRMCSWCSAVLRADFGKKLKDRKTTAFVPAGSERRKVVRGLRRWVVKNHTEYIATHDILCKLRKMEDK